MTGAGQRDLPIEIRIRPLARDGLRPADAAAVRAAKPRPLLRVAPGGRAKTQSDGKIETGDSFHSLCGEATKAAGDTALQKRLFSQRPSATGATIRHAPVPA